MAMKKKYNRKLYDWKDYPSITWPYTGDDPLTNKKYLKDRSELDSLMNKEEYDKFAKESAT